jgi:dihydrofolate reductase
MRSVIVYIATSADGYIARPDGGVEWLDRPHPPGDYGMPAFYDSVDTVLVGRKTWKVGVDLGATHFSGKKNYVFSHTPQKAKKVEFIAEDPGQFVKRLRAQPGKDIWLVGGAELIATLIDAGQVDRFLIHVVPVLIGEGIPLIAPGHREIQLELRGTETYADGVVKLDYAVKQNG